jgi:protein-S-isoprenylcysteine O-methyltransferase Ste14
VLHSVQVAPFAVLWAGWLLYWRIAALDVKATRRREPYSSLFLNRLLLAAGALLLVFRHLLPHWLSARFLPLSMAVYWLGLVMLASGLALAVWARLCLGRNWSGTVTVKQDHELVRSGPYRFVRHPIYCGLLLAILGTAFAIGEWRALIAFALIVASLVLKIRTEERFMQETFGDDYERYRAAVAALIPFMV